MQRVCDATMASRGRHSTLAIIGVLSHAPNVKLRQAIRDSWLSEAARARSIQRQGLDVAFVVRNVGAPRALHKEARARHDVVFLPARYDLSRKRGPLESLFLWLQCAVARWPRVEFIGKGDDDVFFHLDGIAAHLRASHAAVQQATRSEPRILWGALEGYHWHPLRHRPVGFVQDGPSHQLGRCKSRMLSIRGARTSARGPFPSRDTRAPTRGRLHPLSTLSPCHSLLG